MDVKTDFLEARLDEEIWLVLLATLRKHNAARKILVNINAPAGDVLGLC